MSKITVKRRFAVWLEDAFELEHPSDEELEEFDGDLKEWVEQNLQDFYGKEGVTTLWIDEHKLDLDFPEEEVTIEEEA